MTDSMIKIISDPVVLLTLAGFGGILLITAILFILEYKVKLEVTFHRAAYILIALGSINIPFIIFWNDASILNILSLAYCWYGAVKVKLDHNEIRRLMGE